MTGHDREQDVVAKPSGELRCLESIKQCERTASRVIDGKAVIITIDRNELHVLNEVGTFIWQLADGRSLSAIADEVVREFEVDRERAMLDVRAFAEQLYLAGAVTLSEGKG